METYKIKVKGKLYIGDPCYVLSDEAYDQLLDVILRKDGCVATIKANGETAEMACHQTAYGDGAYDCVTDSQYIGCCGVDSGLIGIIPFELLDTSKVDDRMYGDLAAIVDAEGEVELTYDEGTFYIKTADGNTFEIKTGDDGFEYDDYDGDNYFDTDFDDAAQ